MGLTSGAESSGTGPGIGPGAIPPTGDTRFGATLSARMGVAWYRDGAWQPASVQETGPLPIHPASHALHFASSCFEGLKAYPSPGGGIHLFRLDAHVRRVQRSAHSLLLPIPETEFLSRLIIDSVAANAADMPAAPGSLYVRPVLFGSEPIIAAGSFPSAEACLCVLVSPVGDYFSSGKPLRLLVDEEHARSVERLGATKTGGNYAASLGLVTAAREEHRADQILFCPSGEVGETNASSFVLIREGQILTRQLDTVILHSVTREALLIVAEERGYSVGQRLFDVDEMLEWVRTGEAALAGTAAVLSGVGTLIARGAERAVGAETEHAGEIGPLTAELRTTLTDLQRGLSEDTRGWLQPVA